MDLVFTLMQGCLIFIFTPFFLVIMQARNIPSTPQAFRPKRNKQKKPSVLTSHQQIEFEVKIKLLVNGLLSIASIVAIAKLVPYQLSQLENLEDIRAKTEALDIEVQELRKDFNRNFDSYQTRKVMQEQSPFIAPNQRRIYWKES